VGRAQPCDRPTVDDGGKDHRDRADLGSVPSFLPKQAKAVGADHNLESRAGNHEPPPVMTYEQHGNKSQVCSSDGPQRRGMLAESQQPADPSRGSDTGDSDAQG
jgi:hypothetical protein